MIRATLTFCIRAKELASVTAGEVFGMAQTIVMPPARAAAVPDLKSSLWVAPGSLKCTWISIRPEGRERREISTGKGLYLFLITQ